MPSCIFPVTRTALDKQSSADGHDQPAGRDNESYEILALDGEILRISIGSVSVRFRFSGLDIHRLPGPPTLAVSPFAAHQCGYFGSVYLFRVIASPD